MQDGLEADLLNFLLGQPESRGEAHANTINLLVPFGSKRNAMFSDHVALQTVIAFHAVVFSETYKIRSVSIWFRETQPRKIPHQEGHFPFLSVGALNSCVRGIWRVVVLGMLIKTLSLTRHILGIREREQTNKQKNQDQPNQQKPQTEGKTSGKPTKWIISHQVGSTFSCGLSFNGGGETWGLMACIFF